MNWDEHIGETITHKTVPTTVETDISAMPHGLRFVQQKCRSGAINASNATEKYYGLSANGRIIDEKNG